MDYWSKYDSAKGKDRESARPIESASSDSLTLDVDNSEGSDEEAEGMLSPRQLTSINFQSLIGHTDEVIFF